MKVIVLLEFDDVEEAANFMDEHNLEGEVLIEADIETLRRRSN